MTRPRTNPPTRRARRTSCRQLASADLVPCGSSVRAPPSRRRRASRPQSLARKPSCPSVVGGERPVAEKPRGLPARRRPRTFLPSSCLQGRPRCRQDERLFREGDAKKVGAVVLTAGRMPWTLTSTSRLQGGRLRGNSERFLVDGRLDNVGARVSRTRDASPPRGHLGRPPRTADASAPPSSSAATLHRSGCDLEAPRARVKVDE